MEKFGAFERTDRRKVIVRRDSILTQDTTIVVVDTYLEKNTGFPSALVVAILSRPKEQKKTATLSQFLDTD